MPRYFFDIDDGERKVRDDVGMELRSNDSAMQEGVRLLQTLDELRRSEGRPGSTYLRVRHSDGSHVYTGSVLVRD